MPKALLHIGEVDTSRKVCGVRDNYGETYTYTLQPNEVRMFQISKGGDTTAPKMERAFSDGDKVITVRFNKKVIGNEFTVSGATVESVQQSANDVTYTYDAVLWAAENEITTGMKDGTFGVAGTCTRGQVVTFLWRAMGK